MIAEFNAVKRTLRILQSNFANSPPRRMYGSHSIAYRAVTRRELCAVGPCIVRSVEIAISIVMWAP